MSETNHACSVPNSAVLHTHMHVLAGRCPAPQVVIGPITPRAARPGPLDPPAAAAFLDAAPGGAALVSFGSVPLFGTMFLKKQDFVGLALAFADLAPIKVLWLLKRRNWPADMTQEELPLGNNTLIVEWVVGGLSCCVRASVCVCVCVWSTYRMRIHICMRVRACSNFGYMGMKLNFRV